MKLILVLSFVGLSCSLKLHDVSDEVGFGKTTVGYVAALGDLTSDHSVDVVLVNATCKC